MRRRSTFGWMELIAGVLLILLGIFSFVRPDSMLTSIVVIYGVVAIVTGISDVVFFVRVDRHTGFGPTVSLITGVLSVMTGCMLLVYPGAGKWILSLLFPIWFIAHCISRLSHLNMIRFTAGNLMYYFTLIVNIIGLVLGILMIIRPYFSLLSAAFIIGFYLILLGVDSIITAFSKMGGEW
ncbi:MAG: HdeD family acid-resistance protein [Lachnospiraceae bacterium]